MNNYLFSGFKAVDRWYEKRIKLICVLGEKLLFESDVGVGDTKFMMVLKNEMKWDYENKINDILQQ